MPSVPNVRVLLAEDDKDVRELLCDALRSDGFMVMAVADGTEAIRAFRNHDFDIVVTDLALPGHTGFQVAQACRRQRSSTKVIVLTAWDALVEDLECVDHGVDLLIPKTVGITALLKALRELATPARYRRLPRILI